MAATTSGKGTSILKLIFVPALISLAITIIRLIGELQHWPTALFNPTAGGAGAIIGIVWLAPIFGIYFALKLSDAGEGPEDRGRAVRLAIVGLVLLIGGGALVGLKINIPMPIKVGVAILLLLMAVGFQYASWPKLFKTLLAYGYAARIPVLIVMFFAIKGDWGTHYDVAPTLSPDTPFWPKFFQIAFVPQMVLWIAFTIIIGMLTGSIAAALKRRGQPATQTASA